jgi:signal transduction histidine kinase
MAQEAVMNAIKHGRAREIVIGVAVVKGGGVLTVRDNGSGFETAKNHSGLGFRTMDYRAKMIGGSLSVQSSLNGGTLVRCMFPLVGALEEEQHVT